VSLLWRQTTRVPRHPSFKLPLYPRSFVRIFGTQVLNHVPYSCCLISTSQFLVFSCYSPQAVLYKAFSRTICSSSHFCLIHGVSLLSSALSCQLVIAIAIHLVQPSIYLWSFILLFYKSCHSTAVLRFLRSLRRHCQAHARVASIYVQVIESSTHVDLVASVKNHTAVISVPQVILLLPQFHLTAVHSHCCRCRLHHPCHESQHPSLTGALHLERVYCHELPYVNSGLNCSLLSSSIANNICQTSNFDPPYPSSSTACGLL
jgi:hypothetical protein